MHSTGKAVDHLPETEPTPITQPSPYHCSDNAAQSADGTNQPRPYSGIKECGRAVLVMLHFQRLSS